MGQNQIQPQPERRNPFSIATVVNGLVVAFVTAGATTWATAQRVDARMMEVVTDLREIKVDHAVIRERIARNEERIEQVRAQARDAARLQNGTRLPNSGG